MANITLLPSTKYSIVSITASTRTIVVSGDASAQITAGRRFRLAGTASDDGFYTVVTSVYSSPNTTIVCTENLDGDGAAIGTADLQRVLRTAADWVGGVAPGVSDVGIIPSNGNLDGSSNYGSLTCESGGTVTLDNGSSNNGSLTCESGGTVTIDNGSGNYGSLTCESGGTVTLDGSSNNGSLTCESGGTVTIDNGSGNYGSLTCESGGTVTLDGSDNSGSLTCESGGTVTLDGSSNSCSLVCFLYGTVTGATPIQLTIEKRTLHYTAGQSTDTLPVDQGGTITLRNSTTVLDVVSPTPGSAATTWENARNTPVLTAAQIFNVANGGVASFTQRGVAISPTGTGGGGGGTVIIGGGSFHMGL